ncbi:MAG: MurR/RpiR family transcriptional regulator [Chloroflexi bacterium]|nr:MAG: MurR/RpiR family transcriptional regulator [Chloroflexota bacterium]
MEHCRATNARKPGGNMAHQQPIDEVIRRHYDELSPSHKRIARFLLDEPVQAATLAAARIGELVGASEATVVRLANALEYDGFPSLQEALRERLAGRLNAPSRLQFTLDRYPDSDEALLRAVMQADMEAIGRTLRKTSPAELRRAVDLILAARCVHILALRTAASIGIVLYEGLSQVLGNVNMLEPGLGHLPNQFLTLNQDDLLISISYHRYATATVKLTRHAQEQGIKTLAITDTPISPIARDATVVLTADFSEPWYFFSAVAPLSLVNVLIAAVAGSRREQGESRLEEAEAIYEKLDIFYREE